MVFGGLSIKREVRKKLINYFEKIIIYILLAILYIYTNAYLLSVL